MLSYTQTLFFPSANTIRLPLLQTASRKTCWHDNFQPRWALPVFNVSLNCTMCRLTLVWKAMNTHRFMESIVIWLAAPRGWITRNAPLTNVLKCHRDKADFHALSSCCEKVDRWSRFDTPTNTRRKIDRARTCYVQWVFRNFYCNCDPFRAHVCWRPGVIHANDPLQY